MCEKFKKRKSKLSQAYSFFFALYADTRFCSDFVNVKSCALAN